ncbi:MAG: DinB family protein [Acidiferrobacterales bacterium]
MRISSFEHAQRWISFIDTIDVQAYDSVLGYLDSRGHTRKVPFSPTLSHVFNHGMHHRGQISAAMTRLGLPAPELDLIYYLIESA